MSLSSSHSFKRLSFKRVNPESCLTTTHLKNLDCSERGRLLSAEGLDLGLPGIYRTVSEEKSVPLVSFSKSLENKITMTETQNSLILDYSLSPPQSIYSYKVGEADLLCDTAPLNPPVKPPRTKNRNRLSRKSADPVITSFSNPLLDLSPDSFPGPVVTACNQKLVDESTDCLNSKKKISKKSIPTEENDDVFLEMEKTVCQSPLNDSGLKKSKRNKEKQENLSEYTSTNASVKKSKFFRTFSDVSKYKRREQMKASLSMPFDFQKISLGEMPKSRPLDLIESSRSPMNDLETHHGWDDSHLPSSLASPNPDILSHISPIDKTRTLSYNKEAIKYQTVARRPSASNSKKSFRLFRHFSYRKSSSAHDPQADSLIPNQVDPVDHGLLHRKDSRGSTEDESMDSHITADTKDKKKKDKKKDKKGKPPSRHGSDAKQTDKVRSKLKKFIGRRPTMESLQERGLIKESVFGCPLNKLCEKDGSNVPKFVKLCVEEVEKRGLNVDGIYRVSGNLSHVQKLRYLIDRDVDVNLSDHEWEDIHVITGALKMFLRELPEPVIPFNFFDKFIATCKISDSKTRQDASRSLIRALPKPNRETLKYLMHHFCKVIACSEQNRMQVQNVAIVFGPTLLLKPPDMTNQYDPGGGNMAVYMMYQNQIVDYMLTEFHTLFL